MGTFKTMLAHKSDPKRIDFENKHYYVQPKLDGIRCYITKDGMFTRNHKPIVSCPHIFEWFQKFYNDDRVETIFDGELYNHALKNEFSKIVSLVRKTKPTPEALAESAEKIKFYCYDYFVPERDFLKFSDRIRGVNGIIKEFGVEPRELGDTGIMLDVNVSPVVPVETEYVQSHEEVKLFEDSVLSRGFEGAMIREDAPYEQKRSWTLQKVKQFMDEEFKIVGFEERVSRSRNGVAHEPYKTGLLGKFIMEMPDGRTFGAPPGKGFDHAKLKEIWDDRSSYIGLMATVEFFEYTEYGVPRFPKYKTTRDYE